MYLQTKKLKKKNFQKFKNQNIVITGDLNGYNPIWGGQTYNGRGKVLEELIDEFNYSVLNTGQGTH